MKIVNISEESLVFDDGSILTSDHERECCEQHYLDFSIMETYNVSTVTGDTINIFNQEFDFTNGVRFEEVDGTGILLYDVEGNRYLINGYGYNNGYYSSDIKLIYYGKEPNLFYDYDVSECQVISY